MVEIFNTITNIATQIEKDIFIGFNNFAKKVDSQTTLQTNILNHCFDIITKKFQHNKNIKALISSDTKKLQPIDKNGKYLITYVSIDNIELIDLNFSLGTIFGVYENSFEADNLQAVIYITYGPTFQIVYASKNEGVKYFSYKDKKFTQQGLLTLNEKGKINSPAGIRGEFSKSHKELLDIFFNDGYRLRLSNSLVLDTHQILFKKGGLYSAPATISNPNGSLNIIFEAFPIAFIIELAGGEAISQNGRILDIKSPLLDQKTPIYFGSKFEITKVQKILS